MKQAWRSDKSIDRGVNLDDGGGSGNVPTTKNADDFIKIALLWFILNEFNIL